MVKEMKEQVMLTLLRVALGLVFGFFAISQFMDPVFWSTWIPAWAQALSPLPITTAIHIVSVFELIVAVSFVLGWFTRYTAILGALLLLPIVIFIGWNDVGVRDFGLFWATAYFSAAPPTRWSVDHWWKSKE